MTSWPSPKGLAEFHSVQLEDRVVKAGGVTMSGVSCMISDNSNKPSHPGAQDEWHWGGGDLWLPGWGVPTDPN